MSIDLTADELRLELDFNRNQLAQIKETPSEWVLGTWLLSKAHETWRVGYAHPLVAGAVVRTFLFDCDGRAGTAVFFESCGEPPWIFIGWVPPQRNREAEDWAKFLNSEIERRLAGEPAQPNWTYDPHDGSAAQDYEDELAERKLEMSFGIKPYKPPT